MENRFLKSSILLVLDNMVITVRGLLFWLIIPRLASTDDIGHASSVISTVALVSSIAVLGLEYPLLKRSEKEGGRVFGTLLAFEIIIHLVLIPVIFIYLAVIDTANMVGLFVVSSLFLLSSGIGYISRHVVVGILNIKSILILDATSTLARYSIVIALLLNNWGSIAIVSSYLAQQGVVSIILTIIAIKKLGINIDFKKSYLRELVHDGISNFPAKLAKIVIASLSIILLSLLGFSASSIGIFYIPLMIALGVGGLAASVATVAIPTSAITNEDHSYHGVRFSLILVVPVIAMIITIPASLLEIIHPNYVSASTELQILALSALPFAIVMNAITFLNNNRRMRDLAKLGIIELAIFLATIFPLSNAFGTIGTAFAILASFTSAMIIAVYWLRNSVPKYLVISGVSIGMAYAATYFIAGILPNGIVIGATAFIISLSFLLANKVITFEEIRRLLIANK